MTTIPVEEIRAQAARLTPSNVDLVKVLITVLSLIPVILGWALRMLWVIPSLMLAAFIVGWKSADAQIAARTAVRGS